MKEVDPPSRVGSSADLGAPRGPDALVAGGTSPSSTAETGPTVCVMARPREKERKIQDSLKTSSINAATLLCRVALVGSSDRTTHLLGASRRSHPPDRARLRT